MHYGYVIEHKWVVRSKHVDAVEWDETESGWQLHYNNKIYRIEEVAQEAIDQMEKSASYKDHQFRIVPLTKACSLSEPWEPLGQYIGGV